MITKHANFKTLTLQSTFLRMFSCKKGQTSGSNIAENILSGGISFGNNYKDYSKLTLESFWGSLFFSIVFGCFVAWVRQVELGVNMCGGWG